MISYKIIIGNTDIQNIVLGNTDFYKSLICDIIVQTSDLKAELIKLHDNSTNYEFKSFIESLDILPLQEEKKFMLFIGRQDL